MGGREVASSDVMVAISCASPSAHAIGGGSPQPPVLAMLLPQLEGSMGCAARKLEMRIATGCVVGAQGAEGGRASSIQFGAAVPGRPAKLGRRVKPVFAWTMLLHACTGWREWPCRP